MSKPSILAIIDKPRWAVDNQVSQVISGLGEYSWKKVFHEHGDKVLELAAKSDIVWCANHMTGARFKTVFEQIRHPRVLVTFRSWRYDEFRVIPLMKSGLVQTATAVSRDLTEHVADFFNPVHYISEAVPGIFHPSRVPRIGFVGDTDEYKGFPLIQKAVENCGFQLLVAPRLSSDHGKNLPQSEMPAFYESCDAIVVASEQEGGGSIAMEAMAMNIPVLTTRVGVAANLDCIYIARNVEIIEAGLRRLFGRAKVFPEFSTEAVNEKWAALFKDLLR